MYSRSMSLRCAAATMSLACGIAAAADAGSRYIVMAQENQSASTLSGAVEANGGVLVGEIAQLGMLLVEAENPTFSEAMRGVSGVSAVANDRLMLRDEPMSDATPLEHGSLPGAAQFDGLTWGLDAVGAPAAWAAGIKGAGVRVAVLDSGVDHDHPDLAGNIDVASSASFVPCFFQEICGDGFEDWRISPGTYFNHGTHVAGTIAATGDVGVTGVAPEADIIAVKVCSEFVNGCPDSSILAGIAHAADVQADLINMSVGGYVRLRNDWVKACTDAGYSASNCGKVASGYTTSRDDTANVLNLFRRAFHYAGQKGATIILSSGNASIDTDTSKDLFRLFNEFPNTIGINALAPEGWCLDPTTSLDEPASYTNYGRSTTDFAAPGGDFDPQILAPCTIGPVTRPAWVFDMVFSTISGGWGWSAGTSMAAPHATGIAALLISAHGGAPMPPTEVKRLLAATADDLGTPGHDPIYGGGRVHSGFQ